MKTGSSIFLPAIIIIKENKNKTIAVHKLQMIQDELDGWKYRLTDIGTDLNRYGWFCNLKLAIQIIHFDNFFIAI